MQSRRRWGWRNEEETDRQWLRNNVHQPITQAVSKHSKELVEYLIDEGADVNWINQSNQTPLDIITHQIENYENQIFTFENNEDVNKILTQMKKYKEDSLEW